MGEERTLVDIAVAASPAEVWRAVRDPALISNWFGWDADSLKEEIDFIFAKGVVKEETGRLLEFGEWEGAADRFEIADAGEGARLRVIRRQASFPRDFETAYDEVVEGWIQFVEQLRFLLERNPGGTRRTLRLSGTADEKHRLPSNALGIDGLRDAARGSRYVAELPVGERIEGTIWHEGRHQLGLTVEGWNDALLIVVDRPKSEAAPYGGGAMTLTSFGMEPAVFAAIEGELRLWWNGRYPA
jgi:uncharacterized protein YndB with AHSA1/START domain